MSIINLQNYSLLNLVPQPNFKITLFCRVNPNNPTWNSLSFWELIPITQLEIHSAFEFNPNNTFLSLFTFLTFVYLTAIYYAFDIVCAQLTSRNIENCELQTSLIQTWNLIFSIGMVTFYKRDIGGLFIDQW